MTTYEIIAIVISGLAALFAGVALFYKIRLDKSQRVYITEQHALNKVIRQKEEDRLKPHVIADKIISTTESKIIFTNDGGTDATNIYISFAGDSPWKVRDEDLPIRILKPGKSYKIPLIRESKGHSALCKVMWKDTNGKSFEESDQL